MFGVTALEARAIAIVLLIAGSIAGYGWWHHEVAAAGAQSCLADRTQDAAKSAELLHQKDQAAQAQLQTWQAANRVKAATTTRRVHDAIQSDPGSCAAAALPAGLRDALRGAGSGADQSVPDSPVPAASAAGAYELGRPGSGLLGSGG